MDKRQSQKMAKAFLLEKLEKIAEIYNIQEDFDKVLLCYNLKTIYNFLIGKKVLELGTSGLSSFLLANLDKIEELHIVDASIKRINETKEMLNSFKKSIKFYKELWEDFEFREQYYTDIIWIRGIEHIKEPSLILKKIKRALVPSGRLHIIFPNAFSFHRKLGVYMNILDEPHNFTERDLKYGHYHVFDRFKLISILNNSGFRVYNWEGIILKPLPNNKMMELYKENPKLIDALFKIGKELPDYCAEIYICAIPKEEEK